MKKKAELSINLIVIAAIAMIILVIVAVLLFDVFGSTRKSIECEGLPGGVCVYNNYRTCQEYAQDQWTDQPLVRHPTASCPSRDQFCCIPR